MKKEKNFSKNEIRIWRKACWKKERHQQLINLLTVLKAVLELRKQSVSETKTGMNELVEELGLKESLKPCEKPITFAPEEIAQLNDEIAAACERNRIALSISEERLKIGTWADKIKKYPN